MMQWLPEKYREASVILPMDEPSFIGVVILCTLAIGVFLFFLWPRKKQSDGGTATMETARKHVYLSHKDKGKYLKLFESWVEGEVLAKRMSRRDARKVYLNASIAFDIPQLHPYPSHQEKLKAQLLHKRKQKNLKEAPANLPGDGPSELVKNVYPTTESRFRALFNRKTTPQAA